MEILIKDKFNDILFDQKLSLHYNTNKSDTFDMSESEFREMLLKWRASVFETKPRLVLVDNREFQYPISPEIQLWMVEHISTPVLEMPGVDKFCFVMPEEFISHLSITQFTEEANNVIEKNHIRYFGSLTEAMAWLKE
ncbi:hypothetical protein [Microscilla marina]|uniref:STAS/SEC14 domain-containing protein n=1 Tax=Microscilla marina ATCC 23134 TaxID=313606 RepID=A1ZUF5_MICM2|nr:hypothetical protein [Microscilla marina]EAY25974.1 hypothetical protein M23134_07123 [Microscilla marina ATCC 23134]